MTYGLGIWTREQPKSNPRVGTIGFPNTSAAMSWEYDILGEEKG